MRILHVTVNVREKDMHARVPRGVRAQPHERVLFLQDSLASPQVSQCLDSTWCRLCVSKIDIFFFVQCVRVDGEAGERKKQAWRCLLSSLG